MSYMWSPIRLRTSSSIRSPPFCTATSTGVKKTSGYSPSSRWAVPTISSSFCMFSLYRIRLWARMKTLPISPVSSMLSARPFCISMLMDSSLSGILAPPSTTTCGALATVIIRSRFLTSMAAIRPAHAGMVCGKPTIDGWARWALGNESSTHTSNKLASLFTITVLAASWGANS